MIEGVVFDIRRFAVHDGPGIRTTIFLKGCPLNCIWCHNPESINPLCETISLEQPLLSAEKNHVSVNLTFGKKHTVEQLFTIIKKDVTYYEESGGGVTFSGGEPFFQPEFLYECLKLCKEADIHTAIDTSGFTVPENIIRVLPFTDLFLFDIKVIDEALHQKYTGSSNKIILQNLQVIYESKKKLIYRFPLIPGFNDEEQNLLQMLELFSGFPAWNQISILPYHKLAEHKYKKLSLKNKQADIFPPCETEINRVRDFFTTNKFLVKVGG